MSRPRLSSFRYPPPPTPPPGARQTPPLVGLQLYANTVHSSVPNHRYEPSIMHRLVPPTLQDMTVTTDASSCDLAATFSLPVAFVAAHWLTSRSPMELPGYENAVVHPIKDTSKPPLRRQPLSQGELASYRDLAVALTSKLEPYVHHDKPNLKTPSRPSRARIERLRAQALAAIPDNATSSTSTVSTSSAPETSVDALPFQLISSQPQLPQRRVKDRCSFSSSTSHTHSDLLLSADRKTVTKKCKGLYRCARTSAPLSAAWNYYVEFLVLKNGGEGGMCIGLSHARAPLNRLVGSTDSSVGFHSSGKLVVRRGEWLQYGRPYGEGDTVAMLVEMPPESASDVSSAESLPTPSGRDNHQANRATNTIGTRSPAGTVPRITFFINGESQGTLPLQEGTFLLEEKDSALLLHATACLYRKDSSIEIKCCATEWEYFPSASAVCSGLRATCQRRNSQTLRGSSISSGASERRKSIASRGLGGCDSVLTP